MSITFLKQENSGSHIYPRWVTIRREREREGFFEENERTRVIREREMICFRSSDAPFFLLCGILSECTIARNYSNSHGKL